MTVIIEVGISSEGEIAELKQATSQRYDDFQS
jgi:hypothetical protein